MSEDDTATAALLEFLNAVEAGIAAAKHLIMEARGVAEEHSWLWDPSKTKWQQTQGPSGPYERSEDVNSLDFKTMLKDLAAHQGKLSRDGYFYWTFQNGSTVGRKKR
jgi:hypothetical protein